VATNRLETRAEIGSNKKSGNRVVRGSKQRRGRGAGSGAETGAEITERAGRRSERVGTEAGAGIRGRRNLGSGAERKSSKRLGSAVESEAGT
jgi:hypothetical protein